MYMKVYDVDDGVQCTVCNYLCRYSNAHLRALAREYCRAHASAIRTANGGKDTPESVRLDHAKCSKTFIRDNFLKPCTFDLGENCLPALTKKSDLSYKRAAAACPTRASTMARKFMQHLRECIEKGVFPSYGPDLEDIENWDEIGFDPWGHAFPTFKLFQERRERRFSARHGEHTSFWVTG